MGSHSESPRRPYRSGRRAETAAETRASVLDAALSLFVEHGYGNITIGDIARESGVAVPTVYASTGGKSAILATLIQRGVDDPVVERTQSALRAATDPREAVRIVAHGVRLDNEQHLDIARVIITASEVDQEAAVTLGYIVQAYREALSLLAQRLAELGGLRPDVDQRRATDMLWFLLGFHSWRLFVIDRGWTWGDTERWLADQVAAALLAEHTA
ncbi:TetR/AcrR family transcriptional regulator [Streptomyces sp. E5N91]|uniref:TetR/AcrR family transcriptional regulator n=1 Tax=Streptomyces sp. E5N91 TaxID=1851996 RepID=UPI000EF614CD|nr:TetR/AcrR family transcriptional regulator [Streptomyces sp. E5N91]